ncbi:MAG: Asp23/Gls24 family envelope stress response protein [Merdibacter sp.]
MSISKSTEFGNINISLDAIASLAGGVVTECYGVVGMASQKFVKDGIAELLKKENYSKGVVVRQEENGLELDLYYRPSRYQDQWRCMRLESKIC